MKSRTFRQDAVRLEKEIGQSILASDRLAKVENCAATAARSKEFRKKHDKSFREYRKLFRQSLEYTTDLEGELAETKAELESVRKDCKRLLNLYQREIGVKPKSMGGSAVLHKNLYWRCQCRFER